MYSIDKLVFKSSQLSVHIKKKSMFWGDINLTVKGGKIQNIVKINLNQ